jgi:Zn-dependent protease
MKMKRKAVAEFLLVLPFIVILLSIQASCSVPVGTQFQPKQAAGTVTISNGILEVAVRNSSGIGAFTIGTGQNHPKPGERVLFGHPDSQTTYTTVKVVDNHTEYVTTSSAPTASSGYTLKHLDQYKLSVLPKGTEVTVSWITPEHLAISEVIEISGTDVTNTLVRVSFHVTNGDNITHTVGIRYEWDIMIDGRDGSYLRPWTDPYTPQAWLGNETTWASPSFQFWEATNDLADPVFSIYGSVISPIGATPPTKPDRLDLANWRTVNSVAYDYNTTSQQVAGQGRDSAVLYYWDPFNLSPEAGREVTAYITTFKEAIETGGGSVTWAPSAEGALVASALTVSITSGVSAVASAVSNPESCPSNKLAEKANDILPDSVKKWLDSFICSKTGASIEHRVSFALFFTKQEIISIAVSLAVITFAFSYAKAENLNQILSLVPIVLVTAIIVDLTKDLVREVIARRLGVWSEYRLWYFGLVMFLISAIAFKAPFSSPNRIRHNSPNLTTRKVGILSLTAIVVPLIFAGFFYMLFVNGFTLIGNMGLIICLTAAFFDTIPIPPMNGKDIYDWSKILWLILFIACFALYALCLLLL